MPEYDQFVEATQTANEESGYILTAGKSILTEVLIAIIKDFLSCDNTCYTQPYIGAFWLTTLNGTKFLTNGIVFSAYFHPNEDHKAITVGYNDRKVSIAEKGKWAVCFQTKCRKGNKAGYQTGPFDERGRPYSKDGTHTQVMGAAPNGVLGSTFGKVGQSLSRSYVDGHFACNYIEANC